MINGVVNASLEATLLLDIHGSSGPATTTVVIDTGYNGSLTLPIALIASLSLSPLASRPVTLGDASRRVLDFYETEVEWDGQRRSIAVLHVEGEPLIGTALLQGYKLEADFVDGGLVRLLPLP